MKERITRLLGELMVVIDLKAGRDMTEVVGLKEKKDRQETAVLLVLAVLSVANASLFFFATVENWVIAFLSGVIIAVFFIAEAVFARKRSLLKYLRETIERAIGNRVAVALAVVEIGEGFVLLTRVADANSQRSVFDFEFRISNQDEVLLTLGDLFNIQTATALFTVVYLLEMQAASLEAFKDGPAELLTKEMADALGVKPVPVSYL